MSVNNTKERLLFAASKLGFCNGVRMALEAVENILLENQGKAPVYIFNEIVHNTFIVNGLKNRGVKFVHSLDEVPDSSVIIWSAHGVPPELEDRARA